MGPSTDNPSALPPKDWIACPSCHGHGSNYVVDRQSYGASDAWAVGDCSRWESCRSCNGAGYTAGVMLSDWLRRHPGWYVCQYHRPGRSCKRCQDTAGFISPSRDLELRQAHERLRAWRLGHEAAEGSAGRTVVSWAMICCVLSFIAGWWLGKAIFFWVAILLWVAARILRSKMKTAAVARYEQLHPKPPFE